MGRIHGIEAIERPKGRGPSQRLYLPRPDHGQERLLQLHFEQSDAIVKDPISKSYAPTSSSINGKRRKGNAV